ncbi:uncharacterized protein LOC144743196 isoform X2 [Ciona intestinalis]
MLNGSIGVLCRFRKDEVAITADIEGMFHQFYVAEAYRDFLRFLWWKNDDVEQEIVEYRMKVHIFGATSSPGCANFGLKRAADDEGKRIVQQLCKEGADWDDPVPNDLRYRWERWRNELQDIENLKINRCLHPVQFGTVQRKEIQHFSDASNVGYGQCSYIRLLNGEGKVWCSFLIGKSRVAPLKPMTIPRLELTAALVSARMSKYLRWQLDIANYEEYFWVDSKVVLGYLANDVRRFHVFVANRIQQINELTEPKGWYYVSSKDNPSDCASRGMKACQLTSESSWIRGPEFLWKSDLNLNDVNATPCTETDKQLINDEMKRSCSLQTRVFQREDLYVRRRWRRVQYLANEFWVRWRKEFVQSLQKRNKWQRRMPNIAVDDIVLLDDDHAPRSKWRLARVLDTYPCPDGIVRKVQLMLSERERDDKGKRISAPSILDRPICKLIVLLRASEEKALQIAEDVARDSSTGSHDDEPRSALTLD